MIAWHFKERDFEIAGSVTWKAAVMLKYHAQLLLLVGLPILVSLATALLCWRVRETYLIVICV